MDLMAESDAKTVKAELAKVRRVFNAEWKAKGYKAPAKKKAKRKAKKKASRRRKNPIKNPTGDYDPDQAPAWIVWDDVEHAFTSAGWDGDEDVSVHTYFKDFPAARRYYEKRVSAARDAAEYANLKRNLHVGLVHYDPELYPLEETLTGGNVVDMFFVHYGARGRDRTESLDEMHPEAPPWWTRVHPDDLGPYRHLLARRRNPDAVEKGPAVRVAEYRGQVAYRVPEFEYQVRAGSQRLSTADHILIVPDDFETVALPSDSKGEPLSYLDVWGLKGRVDPDTAMEKMGYEVAGEKRKNPRKNPGCDEIWMVRTGAWDDYDQREEYFSTRAAAVDDVRFTSKHRPKRLYRLTPDGAGDWIEETISEDQWSKD
jgi:hypothetical protein